MKGSICPLALVTISALTPLPAFTQPPAAPPAVPQAPSAAATVDEVVLDIVIRDKKGKPITDIRPEELTVLDNGVKQGLSSFRLVQGKEAIAPGGAKTVLDPMRQLRLVTLAFEPPASAPPAPTDKRTVTTGSSELDQRKLARTAAIDLVKGDQGANVFYSVVVINRRLLVLQPFTNDRDAIVAAVGRATAGLAAVKLASESDAIKSELRRSLGDATQDAGTLAAAANAARESPTAGPPSDRTRAVLARVMLDMLRMDAAMAGIDARLSISALQSLVGGLQSMPGRKSVLYFSSGMTVPPELNVPFQSLVSMANRGNVSFYSVDTRGVMTDSQNKSAAEQLTAAAAASRTTTSAGNQVSAPSHPTFVTREEVMSSDDAETSARQNVQLFIRELAEDTGGFLIGDSNDLRAPLRQINEEISSYYEVFYKPGIKNYDGSFRKIKVDTARKNTVIHARSGYFALSPELRASGLQVFEVPLLKAISEGKLSRDVEFRAGPVLLQPKEEGVNVSLLVEVPLHGLQPKADAAGKTQNVHFSLGALVKDAKGEVVEKLTRDRSFQVTAEQLKLGNFLEKMATELPPGKYTLESAVMDRESGKIGMERSEFEIRPKAKGVGISSLAAVRAYTPNARNLNLNEPFQFQGGIITPTLSTNVRRAEDSNIRLFFVVYQDASISAAPTVEIEFLQNGNSLTKVPLPLPAADARGRIPYVMTIPTAAIPPGRYEVRATARQGDTASQTSTGVAIESM